MADSAGKALYLEMSRGDYTSQVLLVPQILNPSKGKTQKSKLLTRQVSRFTPRKSWRYYSFSSVPLIEKTEDHERALRDVEALLAEVGPFMVGYASGDWKLTNQPLVVELSTEDLNDVWDAKTPNALIRRMLRARTEAGFPADLFPTPAS